jgi:hypothetical protein
MVLTPITLLRESLANSVHLMTGRALESWESQGGLPSAWPSTVSIGFKILHDMRPLKVCVGVVFTRRSKILDKVGGHQ